MDEKLEPFWFENDNGYAELTQFVGNSGPYTIAYDDSKAKALLLFLLSRFY